MLTSFAKVLAVASVAALAAGPSFGGDPSVTAQDSTTAPSIQDSTTVPSVTVVGSRQAEGVLGKEVRSNADETLGRIIDVIVDREGRVRAAVIDFGGFLGVGSRKIAVDWNALSFAFAGERRDTVMLELTREQIKAAPEYKDKRAVVIVGTAGPADPVPFD